MKTTNESMTWLLCLALLGPEWANLIYYSGFGAGVVASCVLLINLLTGHTVPIWLALVFGATMGAMYGFSRVSRSAENLSYYVGWKALFPDLVLKRFVEVNTTVPNTQPNLYKLVVDAALWHPTSETFISAGDFRTHENTFVPKAVLITYFYLHFLLESEEDKDKVRFYFLADVT